MGKLANEVINKFKKVRTLSYEEVQKLYKDRSVKGVKFACDGAKFIIKKVYLKNGDNINFRAARKMARPA